MFIIDFFFFRKTRIKRFTNVNEINYIFTYQKLENKLVLREMVIEYKQLNEVERYDLEDDKLVFDTKEELRKMGQEIGDELAIKFIKINFNIKIKFFDSRIDYLRNLHNKEDKYKTK